jgi:hypothetical protein
MTTSTQVQHPDRASVRTFIQTLIPALALLVVAVPPFVDIVLDEVGKAGVNLPEWLYLALTGASVAWGPGRGDCRPCHGDPGR